MIFFIRYVFWGVCSILFLSCSSDTSTEEDFLVYEIELEKFNIPGSDDYKDSAVAIATTRGINDALKYAKENGYAVVKFPSRQYAIISEWQEKYQTVVPKHDLKGIVVPSAITLDLGDAVFRLLPNNQITYSLFFIYEVENVIINGGHLIGDRDDHVYYDPNAPDSKSHEWGFGFNIVASKNITINGSKVERMTGDAVIINNYQWPKKTTPSDGVKITDCKLFDCRRQGISLIDGNNSEFCFNHIHDIKGTNPMCGIDIEVEDGCEGNYTRIHHNLIENAEKGSIMCFRGNYIDIYENTVNQWITTYKTSQHVKIYNNRLYNSMIKIEDPDYAEEYDNIIIRDRL